ncbi:NADPH-dependent assimilatory sulfite reductase hemoprotein subunit [Leptospira ilyithenensis]|uniref:assimilatory sulfite reductase (NADPH) n=1 Tax=Leptospira ilyithenensis TaxID=2484901 RepID=A0A4R9LQE9_9LEPT|nr:NADPH-dependent assimilatory sulfite reductase hemoprotein subunit [Leptospira ilyithenensis]TGN11658.1 NADPH-dependent assimilatory sulfite reductase hemoprotein subunit [Leptospira ilyithenensis]
MSTPEKKESLAEKVKRLSRGLRGTLTESLKDEHTGSLRSDDQLLLKFHGMYQQDDRDRRDERALKKLERLYSFMIRLRIPGGMIGPVHWEALHNVAGQNATGTIKITTRQTVQLHGILKSKIKPTIKAFDQVFLDSVAACGDVNRNVTCTANPSTSPIYKEIFSYAGEISRSLLPKTRAYYEIWLDEEKLAEKEEPLDPLYKELYLPRKFKIAIAIPPYNDVDILTNDIGLIAIIENDVLQGFNVSIGGGLGTTHGNPDTYPRIGSVIGYIPKKDILKVVYEIVTVQRDFGNREDRKLSRLKYTVDRLGLDFYKAEVEKRTGIGFEKAREFKFTTRTDEFGWSQDKAGNWHYTVFVENGRVLDENGYLLKTALLEVSKTRRAVFRFTCNQNVILSDIFPKDKDTIESILVKYGVHKKTTEASPIRKNSIACVALSTCSLALAEGQRYLPILVDKIEDLLSKHDLKSEPISIRMTGCPNGCARPYISEIGLVGTAYGRYNLHLGADWEGMRLNKKYKENLDETAILGELDNLFGRFSKDRNGKESFGDFTNRIGILN